MTTLPLGVGAYKRTYAREPEVQLVNRFVEKTPTNLKEHIALLSKPGSVFFATFTPDVPTGLIRGFFSKLGLFNGDLFIVSGTNFWRYDGTTKTQITGVVNGTGAPRVTWMKGIGYEYLFIADGTALQWYDGGSKASGTLTSDGTQDHAAVIQIGGVYYTWTGSLTDPLAAGTLAHPWVVNPGASAAADLANLVTTITFTGTPGVDYSSTLGGPSTIITASASSLVLTATYLTNSVVGNSISTTETGAHFSWAATTLLGGGVHALHQVAVPGGLPILSVANLASYVLASVSNSQEVFFINPGETTIDALSFFEKEDAPDPVIDMTALGDVLVIAGAGSTEFWGATGDNTEPFQPIEGRSFSRGIVAGSMVVVDEGTYIFVGDDGRVYSVGNRAYTSYLGPQAISDHGIEERIRTQLRREEGVT